MDTTVDIYDPDFFVDERFNDVLAELRATDPVHWQDMPNEPGYWAVLKHADVTHVARHPELVGEGYDPAANNHMVEYAMALAAERRTQPPREDLTSLILAGNFGGGAMSDVQFGTFFNQLVVAGNDTTKGMLSAGVNALIDHPDQMDALRRDSSLLPGAVEEVLRYVPPLHYFRRTATVDTELHGKQIKAGDKVAMWYTSANRDEDVFVDANRFDIRRSPNPHLSFGIAQHFCLGVHLARLEGRVFFEELLAMFPTIERTGEPRRIRSNLNNGLKALPLSLVR